MYLKKFPPISLHITCVMLIQFCWISKKWLRFFCCFPLIRNKLVITLPYTTPSPYFSQWYEFKKTFAYKNACFRNFGRKMTWFITWIIAMHYHYLSFKNRIMRELVVRAQATHYLFHRKGEKSILLPPKNKVEKKAMKPTNSWETTSFPMAYFHERSWKMERIFTRKRREK